MEIPDDNTELEDAIDDIDTEDDIEDIDLFDNIMDEEVKPVRKGIFARAEEGLFRFVSRRKKSTEPQSKSTRPESGKEHYKIVEEPAPTPDIPKGYEQSNGLLLQKKTLAERVAFQIKHPVQFRMSKVIVNGIALLAFAIGAFLIYSELPTHPEIVIGIILVSIAGSMITNNPV